MENLAWSAFWIGIISAVSLPLGALTAFAWKPKQWLVAALMAFGAGSLLAALTIDLVAVALSGGYFKSLAIGSILGGLLFVFLDKIVGNFGGYRRKFSTILSHHNIQNHKRFKKLLMHIGKTEIFQMLNDEGIDYLASKVESRFYSKGSMIIQAGDNANELYIIQNGLVAFGDMKLSNGDLFGASALFTGLRHGSLAIVLEDCNVLVISKEAIEELLLLSDPFKKSIKMWLLGEDIDSYLLNIKHISAERLIKWREELVHTLDGDCVLPFIEAFDKLEDRFVELNPILKRAPWLYELDSDEVDTLFDYISIHMYEAGETIFNKNQIANHLYIIESGEVELREEGGRYEIKVGYAEAIGNRSFIVGTTYTYTAIAKTATRVWILKRYDLVRLIARSHSFKNRMLSYIEDEELNYFFKHKLSLSDAIVEQWQIRASKSLRNGVLHHDFKTMGFELTQNHGASLAIWLGILLDGIPESLVLGVNMLHSNAVSLSLLAGLFLSNYPEALSSSRGMLENNFSRTRILWMWISIMLFTGIGAGLGYIYMQGVEHHWFAFIEGVAAGAMLTMIAQTMLPEAYERSSSVTGLSTLIGFLVTLSLKEL